MRKRKNKAIGLIFTLLACFSLNIVAEEQMSIANSETILSNEREYTEWLPNDVYDPNRESSTQYGYVQVTSWSSAALTTKPADGYYKTGTAGGETITHSVSDFQGPESNAYSSVIDVGSSNFIPVKISTVTYCHTRIGTRTWYASNDKSTWTKLGTSSTSKTGWDIADTGLTISTNTAYRYYRYTVGATSPGYKGYDSSVYKCTGTSAYNNAGGEQFATLAIEGKTPSYTVYYAPLTWSDAIYDSDTAYTQTSSLKPVSRVLYRYPYYSINYVLDDGSLPDDAVIQYTALASVDLPKPTKYGYTFEGWYDNEEYTGTKYTSITEGTYGDLNLYAKWSANTVALFLMPNNGKSTLPFSTIVVDANTEFPISLTDYSNISKEGYSALGYYGTSAIGGTLYKDNYQFETFRSLVETLGVDASEEESYVYLYAQWSPNMYTLSFDSDGGNNIPSITIACDDIIGKLPVPVKTGYEFIGWFTSATGGSQIVESSKMFSKDTTLYAHWAEKEKALVYIDGVNGNDNNDGLTPSKPVRSLKKAYETFKNLDTFGTLYIVNTVSIDSTVELSKSYYSGSDGNVYLADGNEIKIVRYAQPTTVNVGYEVPSFTDGAMIDIATTGKLTINDIELNGHSVAITEGSENEISEGVVTPSETGQPVIYNYGKLILNNGIITDNNSAGVRLGGSNYPSFNMNGGVIKNNHYGVINCAGGFVMTDGEITGNNNGGVYVTSNFSMSGGIISDNENYGVHAYSGEFEMTGGVISGSDKVGILNTQGTVEVSGGEISYNGTHGFVNNADGTLMIADTIIKNNAQSGIYNTGTLMVFDSVITSTTSAGIWSSKDFGLYGNIEITSDYVDVMLTDSSMILTNSGLTAKKPISVISVDENNNPVYTLGQVLISTLCVEADTIMHEYAGEELWVGDVGDDVALVQTSLNSINQKQGNSTVLAVDGIYGSGTEAAVKEYQTDSNLKVDGITGPRTWGSLRRNYLTNEGCAVSASSVIDNFKLFKTDGYDGHVLRAGDLVNGNIAAEETDIFVSKAYTLTYETSDKSVKATLPEDQTLYWNEINTVSDLVQKPTTHEFIEWNTSIDGSGTSYQAGDSISIDKDTTLYAQWQANGYTATFDSNGGVVANPSTITKKYGETLGELPTTSKTGYTFLGWYTEKEGGELVTPETKLTKNVTYYAHWDVLYYTVSFNSSGGTTPEPSEITKPYGSEIGPLPTTTKAGYTFLHWTMGYGNVCTEKTIVNGNIVCVAVWEGNNYTVKYDANGGEGSMEDSHHVYGVHKTLSKNTFTKEGYTFIGWGILPDGNDYIYQDEHSVNNLTTVADGTVILYAQWSANSYVATFDPNGGNKANPSTITKNYGEALGTLPTTSKVGYTFVGWFTEKVDGTQITESTIMPAEDVAYYAHWEANKYLITFKADDNKDVIIEKTYGENMGELPTPERTGYYFHGWYTQKEGGRQITKDSPVPSQDTTYYARWLAYEYVVVYHANDGTNSSADSYHTYGKEQALAVNRFTRKGYTFKYWTTEEDGSGTVFTDGQTVVNLTDIDGATVDLYAQWEANAYRVKYDANGGSGEMADSLFTYDVEKTLSSNSFIKTGYTFTGWNTNKDGSGKSYSDEQSVTNLVTDETDEITLYAQWSANRYTIEYDANGGNGTMSNSVHTYDVEKVLNSNQFIKTGYTFVSWNLSKYGILDSYADKQTVKNLTSDADAIITLYAQWKANQYTVVYHSNGGSGTMDSSTFVYDKQYNLPTNAFTRTGHTFKYWTINEDGSGAAFAEGQSVTNLTDTDNATIDLYAQWEPNTYKVKYDANGGSGNMTGDTFTYGTEQKLSLNKFVRTGYSFTGWNTNPDGTGDGYTNEQSVSDLTTAENGEITLYAQWSANKYLLTFKGDGIEYTVIEKTYGESIGELPSPEKTGYYLAGWYTQEDGGEKITEDTLVPAQDTTYYAQWSANGYTVVYHANDGTDSIDDSYHTYDKEQALAVNTFTRKGYTFKHWTTEEDGSGTIFTDGQMVINLTDVDGGTIDLYAQWEAIPYTVNFVLDGYDVLSFKDKTVLYENKIGELPTSTLKGVKIVGWYTEANGNGTEVNEDTIIYDDTTFYANIEIVTHKLIFNANGGTVSPETKEVIEGLSYGELFTPEREEYVFDGWYTEATGGTLVKGTHIMGSEDTTIYAHWHSANFNLYGITVENGTIASGNDSTNVGGVVGALDGSARKVEIVDVSSDNDYGLIANQISSEKIVEVLNIQGVINTNKLFDYVDGTFTLNGALIAAQTNGSIQLSSNSLVPTSYFEVYYASDITTSEFGTALDFTPSTAEDVMKKNLSILNQYYNYWESVGTRYPRLNDNE